MTLGAAPADDPQVARVLVHPVRLERTRQFGACYLSLELWKRLELDRFFDQAVDNDSADVPWSRVAALLAINRLCAPGSELAIEQGDRRAIGRHTASRIPDNQIIV